MTLEPSQVFLLTSNLRLSLADVLVDYLPWETLGEICKHADVPTLAALCRTSFGMVELAGPLLYEKMDIVDEVALVMLFFEPSAIPSASRLRAHVGFHLVRELSLLVDGLLSYERGNSLKAALPPARLHGAGPLHLDRIYLRHYPSPWPAPGVTSNVGLATTESFFEFFYRNLAQHLNPAVVEFAARPEETSQHEIWTSEREPFAGWTRTRLAVFSGFHFGFALEPFVSCSQTFPDLETRPRSRYDYRRSQPWVDRWMGKSPSRHASWALNLSGILNNARMEASRSPVDTRPGHIEIVVSDQEDHAAVAKFVSSLEVEWEKALFKVVLET